MTFHPNLFGSLARGDMDLVAHRAFADRPPPVAAFHRLAGADIVAC